MTIIDKAINANGQVIRHGKYSYCLDVNTGEIRRCKTEDIGRRWIDSNGCISGAWETIYRINP